MVVVNVVRVLKYLVLRAWQRPRSWHLEATVQARHQELSAQARGVSCLGQDGLG